MQNNHICFCSFILIMSLTIGCSSEFDRAMKSNKKEDRYKVGSDFYEKKEYYKAISLLTSISSLYQRQAEAERIQYLIADSYYQTEQFLLAAHSFNDFVKKFPNSTKAEEAYFLYAYSYYLQSPRYELDQEFTQKAIEELQKFINKYPNSKKVVESDSLIDLSRKKLEKKDLEIGKNYHKTRNYLASVVKFRNFLDNYLYTHFREEAFYYLVDSSYKLAINSIEDLKKERLIEARTSYLRLLKAFPNSKYKKQVDKIKNIVDKELQILQVDKRTS